MGPSRYNHPKRLAPRPCTLIARLAVKLTAGRVAELGSSRLLTGTRHTTHRNPHNAFCCAARKKCSNYAVSRVNFMVKPNGLLVAVSFMCCHTSTSALSTRSSSWALISLRLGHLILGKVSRLYAFSAYPDQTSLPSGATGVTTGSQEVCSAGSSRTTAKPLQMSYAHHR